GFELQTEKIQRMPPWRYLGLQIGKRTSRPQKISICDQIRTLNDAQQLCGSISWVRPWLGLTNEDLTPLFNLLKGGEDLNSPRYLNQEARTMLEKVQEAIQLRQVHRYDPTLPFKYIILGCGDPLLLIEWVFLSHQHPKRMTTPQELVAMLIQRGRARLRELSGCDFETIYIPLKLKSGSFSKSMLEQLLQDCEALQFTLEGFSGQLSIHKPVHKLFNQDNQFTLALESIRSRTPLDALTVFTDASGSSHKSAITWEDPLTGRWESNVKVVEGSPQVAELDAVVRVFRRFPGPFTLVMDSACVEGVVARAENAVLQEVSNPKLFELLSKLINLVSNRQEKFFVMHVRSHTDLPGFVADGNRRADALAAPAGMAPLPNVFKQARLSHQLHYQNALGLVWQFQLTRDQAKAIVTTCPSCQCHAIPSFESGVNPQGLGACEVWQTDVTHVLEFGWLKYIHVSIDTFSGAIFTSSHTGER
ncbi:POK11 protein, partial [Chloropsis hardwickii]|nr:POK11 protein [Chloropsis hardwickii]